MRKKVYLLMFIVLAELLGSIGAIATYPNIATWYASIEKPFFTPPNWVFGPAWTLLFALIGASAYLVWKEGTSRKQVKLALGANAVQMLLNILWSFLFFGAQDPGSAFAEIVFLWFAIAGTIYLSWKVSRKAGYLLVPYILWVSFAAFLNYSVWMLN